MVQPLQQHPHFADCLRAGGREVLDCEHGNILLRRLGGVSVGLVSRGSTAMLDADVPKRCLRLFTAEHAMGSDLRQRGFARLRPAAEVAEWDISGPAETWRRRMRKSWRHDLDAAAMAGFIAAHGPEMNHQMSVYWHPAPCYPLRASAGA